MGSAHPGNQFVNVLRDARDKSDCERDTRKTVGNKHRRPATEYNPVDLVLIKGQVLSDSKKHESSKLTPKWNGPYKIKRVSKTAYLLEYDNEEEVGQYHLSDTKRFIPRGEQAAPAAVF
ncbi:hypothetical protein ILUMI_16466 [Ignelater luminosus]|uniref:Uncharacterized protein n=1 Tax=Ignelater luminosus TaxID=2038154 RepID=A0A8K0G5Y8_IGNLU|nr:hypothetical protein ILUMI_16466 [Ignelater luminosus]